MRPKDRNWLARFPVRPAPVIPRATSDARSATINGATLMLGVVRLPLPERPLRAREKMHAPE